MFVVIIIIINSASIRFCSVAPHLRRYYYFRFIIVYIPTSTRRSYYYFRINITPLRITAGGGRKCFLRRSCFCCCTFFARVLPVYRLYYYDYEYTGTSCARCTWLRTGFLSTEATGGRVGVIPARHCFDLGDKKKKPIPSPRALKPVGGCT